MIAKNNTMGIYIYIYKFSMEEKIKYNIKSFFNRESISLFIDTNLSQPIIMQNSIYKNREN